MLSVIKEAYYDKIIPSYVDDNLTGNSELLDWMVYKTGKQNSDPLMSLIDCIVNALNGHLDLLDAETTNRYAQVIYKNKKAIRRFTPNSLLEILHANISEPPELVQELADYYDLVLRKIKQQRDPSQMLIDSALRVLQEVLNIKFIIFQMFPLTRPVVISGKPHNFIPGDIVYYNDTTYKILAANEDGTFVLYNGSKIENVNDETVLRLSSNNLLSEFRLNCCPIANNVPMTDYIYILETKKNNGKSVYYNVRDIQLDKFVYDGQDIPLYISYFIITQCDKENLNGFDPITLRSLQLSFGCCDSLAQFWMM
jgi:hypothetical protein